jgi:hypothetical protein
MHVLNLTSAVLGRCNGNGISAALGTQVSVCNEHVLIARGLINIQAFPVVSSH